MKYKINDVIASDYNGLLYLYKVMGRDSTNYLVTCVDSDNDHLGCPEAGKELSAPTSSIDAASHVSLAFNHTQEWKLPGGETLKYAMKIQGKVDTRHACICDKFQVVHFGCKCGGC